MTTNSIGKEEAKMRSKCVLTIASTIATKEMLVNLINTLAHYGSHLYFFFVEFVREARIHIILLFFFRLFTSSVLIPNKYNQAMNEQ